MKNIYSSFVILFLLSVSFTARAQDSTAKPTLKDIVQFGGYLKDMQIAGFSSFDSISTYNEIHNRLNFKIFPARHLSAALELRNRIYYGQQVQNTPGFGNLIKADNGYVNLSANWIHEKALVANTQIDRVWLDWANDKWEVRLGRQRINWGKTLVWNSNDLFNTYNYADFDYEEQPGSDALRLTYYPSGMSALEAAIKPGRNKNETVAAGVWRFNKNNYDYQVLGGLYQTDIAIGAGWSGYIKDAGFKGEATWFQPKDHLTDTTGVLSATASFEYAFKSTFILDAAVLYNSHTVKYNSLAAIEQTFAGTLSAKNLMPSDWSAFASLSAQFTPLFHGSLAAIYGLKPGFLFTMPSLTYSISDNWEIMLLEQGIFVFNAPGYKPVNNVFIRLKWSF